ncbi:hypothetical protein TPL01_00770 [Sulfuriferula plumbiphila]|uniref:Uncharacterized protein n=1 Tax=Sulfuriferula plumbiphila TaxID=171865 RepID=A0A512L397_9PROT|nr:hypothetical protein [Sulfuriferula plumbiphila]BBP02645.1 hypothetical protein SFPGR_00670 [Sulfuriferula plumbiphila]GEP28939.1 hypothetical protein TPL01_00770 [Sulfuriferula plumbiphila]
MIVFDIESGRIDAPSFNHPPTGAAQSETDVARPDTTLPVLRLMTLEEARWMEARRAGATTRAGM